MGDEGEADVRVESRDVTQRETPAEPAEAAPAQDQQESPEGDSAEAATDSAEDAGRAEAESDSETDRGDTQEGIETLSDLARAFEVDEPTLLQQLKVDVGDEGPLPLQRLIETYKAAPEAVRRYEETLKIDRDLERERESLRGEHKEALAGLVGTTQALIAKANEEFADVNWKELERDDPSQYLIMKGKRDELAQLVRSSIEQIRGAEEAGRAQAEAQAQQSYAQEMDHLMEKMPTWRDQNVAREAMTGVRDFLLANGFTAEEINGIQDHRMILVAHQASQFQKMKSETPQKLKKLRELPKPSLKSAARQNDARVTEQKVREQQTAKLRRSGEVEDAARLMEDLL